MLSIKVFVVKVTAERDRSGSAGSGGPSSVPSALSPSSAIVQTDERMFRIAVQSVSCSNCKNLTFESLPGSVHSFRQNFLTLQVHQLLPTLNLISPFNSWPSFPNTVPKIPREFHRSVTSVVPLPFPLVQSITGCPGQHRLSFTFASPLRLSD